MLHGGEDHGDTLADEIPEGEVGDIAHGVNGPHATDPPYDPNAPIPPGTEPIHLHPKLSIWVNGNLVPIPVNIGKVDFIHTHAADGILHVHPFTTPGHFVTLGDFFNTWKTGNNPEPNAIFNKNNLMGNAVDATHTVQMFVNGTPVDVYENYQLHDGDDIVVSYSANPIVVVNTNVGSVPVELFRDKAPITVNNFLNYVNDGDYVNSFFHRYIENFVLQGGGFKSSTSSFSDPSVANSFTSVPTDAQIQNEFDNFAKRSGTGATVTSGNTVINLGSGIDLSNVVVGDRIRLTGFNNSTLLNITAVNDSADTVTIATPPTGSTASNVTWTIFPKVNLTGTLAMAKVGNNPNSATSQFFINLANNDANLDLQNGGFTVFGQILDQSILNDITNFNNISLFTANLTGAQEVPPVTTSATGSATLALNNGNNEFDLKVNVQGITAANINNSHIHSGAVGVDGNIIFDLGTQYTTNGNQVTRFVDDGAFPTANNNLTLLNNSQNYVNVHTIANPDGEIRGQLTALQGGLYSDLPTNSTDELITIQSITGLGTVKGQVFTDADNDSTRDQSEVGRQGFTVFDDANNNGILDAGEASAASDVTGAYSLQLPSGQHKIRLVPTSGFAKTTPADAHEVTVQVGREVTGRDFGVLQVPTLTGLDLAGASDSGASSTDNITNFNNSATGRAMQFTVTGVVDGALVRILSDGTTIGQATVPAGSNGTITVTTNGTTTVADGTHSIVATQELRGVQSTATASLGITIDTAGPQFTSTPPTTANVGVAVNYNAQSPEEGQTGFLYALLNAPTGAAINSSGTLAWTPIAAQVGTQQFQISATDAAGNVTTQPLSVAVSKIALIRFNLQTTDTNGAPITTINVGQTFQLRATVEDLRLIDDRDGVFAAYEDVGFDGNIATATAITHSSIYGQGSSGTLSTGLIDEIGSFAPSIAPLGPNPQLLYTVTLTANRSGTLTFTGNAPDVLPQHEAGIYGRDAKVPTDEVEYGLTTLTVSNPDLDANDDVFNFDEDTGAHTLDVLSNDVSNTGTTKTIVSTTPTTKGGTVTIAADNKSLVYTAPANFFGEDQFTYIMTDGSDQAVATVRVQSIDINDAPPAISETLTGEDAVEQDSTGNVLDILKNERAATNVDQGAPNEVLRILSVGPTSNGGTVTIGSQGGFVNYTPAPNFSGTETFTYTVTDRSGSGGLTATATATVTVTGVTRAVADTFPADEDSSNNVFNVLANDTVEAGKTLTITAVGTGSRGGTITRVENNTKVSYTPAANVFGPETFTYTISDGASGTSTGTVTVNLAAKNDAPNAQDDTVNVGKNSIDNILTVLSNDLSAPDDTETFVITAVTQGNHGGVVEIIENGAKIRYKPATGFLGAETFTYTMRDPGNLTDTATVNVTVRDFVASSLAGFVYVDSDNDGVFDSGEQPIANVTITLTGTDNFGAAVNQTTTTDSTGAYKFQTLAPSNSSGYKLKETQPTAPINGLAVTDGKDTVGSQGGTASANDEFTITLAENVTGTGNNFGENTGFQVTGLVRNADNIAALHFNAIDVNLQVVDDQGNPVGDPRSTKLKADGTFKFDGVSAGRYALTSGTLSFLQQNSGQQIINVNGDSLNNILVQGSRQAKYITYRDYLNSTPRTGIFAAATPGTNGQQWSALDSNWTGFTEVKVGLSADATKVRLDATKTNGDVVFDEIPVTDNRVAILAQEGNARLLRLSGASSSYNLRAASTASGEGEASGAEGEFGGTEDLGSTLLPTTIIQPGTLDDTSAALTTDSDPLAANSQQDVLYVMPSDSDLFSSPSDELDSDVASNDANLLTQAIDAVMAEQDDSLLDTDSDLEHLANHHHDDASTLDAVDAVLSDDPLLASV